MIYGRIDYSGTDKDAEILKYAEKTANMLMNVMEEWAFMDELKEFTERYNNINTSDDEPSKILELITKLNFDMIDFLNENEALDDLVGLE